MKHVNSYIPPLIALVLVCGCSRKVYIPVEKVHTEYREADTAAIYKRMQQLMSALREKEVDRDSFVDRRKDVIVLNERGDTTRQSTERIIYRSTQRERELEKENAEKDQIIDSLMQREAIIKVDSVAVPYPIEKQLGRWERMKLATWWWIAGIAIAAVFWPFRVPIFKLARMLFARL